jgi:DNA repair protein RecN (Recombination protein N)
VEIWIWHSDFVADYVRVMPKVKLVELSAQSLGVIEKANLEFAGGFSVLTGETGAGKTLLLGALELCLGEDGAQSRHAVNVDTKASVVFSQGGEEIVLAREASPSGRLRAVLNGLSSNAESLRNTAGPLIVIHGQHDSLALKSRSEILRLIDGYSDIDSSEYDSLTRQILALQRLRNEAGGDEAGRLRELEFLRFQLEEISAAKISDSEELTKILNELQDLSDVRDGQVAVSGLIEALDGADDSILDQFATAIARLPEADIYASIKAALNGSLLSAREAIRELVTLSDPDALDSGRLEDLEARAGLLQNLIRKYGPDLTSVIGKAKELEVAVSAHLTSMEKLASAESDLVRLEADLASESKRLLELRSQAAEELTRAISKQLERVALPHATIRFSVQGAAGTEAEILFAPNPGQSEGPLQTLASGGELSRVLLAISLETSRDDQVAVFDEVDAGVGGQVAQQIGECLREVGQRQQVLAVTHLASVAAKADQHFVVEKSVSEGKTVTTIREVSGVERVNEIARMLSGEVNTASVGLASHLLEES